MNKNRKRFGLTRRTKVLTIGIFLAFFSSCTATADDPPSALLIEDYARLKVCLLNWPCKTTVQQLSDLGKKKCDLFASTLDSLLKEYGLESAKEILNREEEDLGVSVDEGVFIFRPSFGSVWKDPLVNVLEDRESLAPIHFRNGSVSSITFGENDFRVGFSEGTEAKIGEKVWTFRQGSWNQKE